MTLSGKALAQDTREAKYICVQTLYRYLQGVFIGDYQHHEDGVISAQELSKLLKLYWGEITVHMVCLKLFSKHLATAVGKILDYPDSLSLCKLLLKNQADQWKCCMQGGCKFEKLWTSFILYLSFLPAHILHLFKVQVFHFNSIQNLCK